MLTRGLLILWHLLTELQPMKKSALLKVMKRCLFQWRTRIPTCLQLQRQLDSSLLPLRLFLPPHRPAQHANMLTRAHRNHMRERASSKIISELALHGSAAKGDGPVSQPAFQQQRGCELPPPSCCTPSSWLCATQ